MESKLTMSLLLLIDVGTSTTTGSEPDIVAVVFGTARKERN